VDRYPQLEPLFDDHDGSEASWVADDAGRLVPWEGDDEG